MNSEKMFEVLLEELRTHRTESREDINRLYEEIKALREGTHKEIESVKKDINTLKTRFMIVAVSMGLAGGKISSMLPFLK